VDAAIMVIDGAKGVESQTQKLFEVCRLRDLPILTFCNKMDRESRDTFEIIDEIQENLAIDVTPASWPIGMGRDFLGCYDLIHDRLELMDRADRNKVAESVKIEGLDDPNWPSISPRRTCSPSSAKRSRWRANCCRRSTAGVHQGTLTPIWFGSAINSFGVKELMDGIAEYGPEPQVQTPPARGRAGGKEGRGLRLQGAGQHGPQAPRPRGLRAPRVGPFPARHETDPCAVEETDGDLEPGALPRLRPRIGRGGLGRRHHRHPQPRPAAHRRRPDRGRGLRFTGIPSFAPELLQNCRAGDPLKAKHLDKALMQFAEEGAAKVFKPTIGSGFVVGVVGALQFEVLASRIELEYGLPVRFEPSQFTSARWVSGPKDAVEAFANANKQHMGRTTTATRST
jgi:peptide chain release factor 3